MLAPQESPVDEEFKSRIFNFTLCVLRIAQKASHNQLTDSIQLLELHLSDTIFDGGFHPRCCADHFILPFENCFSI
jgi:hypothetical protein